MEGKKTTDGGGHGGDERAVGPQVAVWARCPRRPRPSAGGAPGPIPLTASGRKKSCPCSGARPPAGSGQRQLSSGWRRNSPAGSAPPNFAPCNADYRTGGHSTVPDQEVYFPQEHPPGREAQLDFTHCNSLGVTIGGRRYRHLLFQLVLSHSGWRYAEVVAGETFLALKQGLQNALWELGGAPQIIRSDNSSALTHEIKRSRGRALNDNYAELLEQYGLEATLINSGESHENGVAEQAHYRLKDALDQALMLRGSRDFDSAESYTGFVRKVVERRNRLVQGKLEQERPLLQCLPPAPVPEYVNHQARVRKWSTIQAAGRTYTVPSRLIGKEVQIRLYAERLEVYYKGHLVERMERVRGEREANVNYRHVIGSLVRKPGAFARYRFREQMFPTMTFRLAYDALKRWRGERADVEYVRILHLAATTMESTVDSALALLLEAGEAFDYATVKELANPAPPRAPVLSLSGMPDLRVYDSLLAGVA